MQNFKTNGIFCKKPTFLNHHEIFLGQSTTSPLSVKYAFYYKPSKYKKHMIISPGFFWLVMIILGNPEVKILGVSKRYRCLPYTAELFCSSWEQMIYKYGYLFSWDKLLYGKHLSIAVTNLWYHCFPLYPWFTNIIDGEFWK